MNDLSQTAHVIRRTNTLWKEGKPEEALTALDAAIGTAVSQRDNSSIRLLCHHAAIIADSIADLRRARQYFERSISYNPTSALSLYGLATNLAKQGEAELAREYAGRCFALIINSEDEIDRGLLERIVKQWPELGS